MIHELRHYIAVEGKDVEMMKLMMDEILPVFKRLGFKIDRYWVQEGASGHHWYVMPWTNAKVMQDAWSKFREDAECLKIKQKSGHIFGKVDSFILNEVPGGKLT